MFKLKENKKVLLVFVASFVILISVGIFSYYTLSTLNTSEKSVNHIRNILQATNNTLLDMVKIEEKYNKFVFTDDKSDENTFRAVVFTANQDIKVLINLTYDNSVQNNRALSLEYLLHQRIEFAEMAFDLSHYNRYGLKSVDYRDQIHLITDQFEAISQQMQGEEERILLLRNADVARLLSQSKTVLVLGTFLGLLLTATAFWNVLRDSSGRRLAERALFTEHEHAQVTLNSIGDAVVSTDPQGIVTFLNFVAEKMTGWSRHGAAGRPMDEVYRIREARNRTVAPSWTEMAMQQDATITLPSDCILFRREGRQFRSKDVSLPSTTAKDKHLER
jgi:PAS domain S-box-containing protein